MKKSFTLYLGDLSELELTGLETILKNAGVDTSCRHYFPLTLPRNWHGFRVERGIPVGYFNATPYYYGFKVDNKNYGRHFHIKRELKEFLAFLTAEEELLPCPFCGTKAVLHGGPEWWVKCSKVGVCIGNIGSGCTFKEDAVKLWNTRKETHEHKTMQH